MCLWLAKPQPQAQAGDPRIDHFALVFFGKFLAIKSILKVGKHIEKKNTFWSDQ